MVMMSQCSVALYYTLLSTVIVVCLIDYVIEIIEGCFSSVLYTFFYFEMKAHCPVKTKLNRFIIIISKKANKGERYIKAFNKGNNGVLFIL